MKIWETNLAIYLEKRSDIKGDHTKQSGEVHTHKEKQTKYK